MDEIGSGLFVGTIEDAGNSASVEENGVTSVVSLTYAEPDGGFPRGVSVTHVPIMDGPRCDRDDFTTAVERTVALLETGERVLIHCRRGSSRSPSVAAVALAVADDVGVDAAFQQVRDQRPAVDPHEAVVHTAVAVYEKLSS